MRKFTILATIIAFVGCSQYSEKLDIIISTPTNNPNEFYASMPECDTRTYVEDNKYLRWNAGDEITVFAGNSYNGHWQFAGEDGANSGKFNEINEGGFITGSPLDLTANYAIYPYDENITISEAGVVSLTLPAVQAYNHTYANSFGVGANTMMAVTQNTTDNFLAFKNICGYLKLKFYGDDITIKSITVKGNNGEKIAGKATVSMAYGGEPTITMGDDATDTIAIDCGEGVALSNDAANPTTFWVVIPEITFEGGITIEVTDINDQTFSKTTTNAVPIENNLIQPMAALKVSMIPENRKIYYTSTAKITPYATGVFGAQIVSNDWDAQSKEGLIIFNDKVANIGNKAFYACRNLLSITIPEGVISIGDYAFYNCMQLENIAIPQGVTSIGKGAFNSCYSLTSVTIPQGVTSIGNIAFYDCNSLTSITIPSSVTTIGGYAFEQCTSLTSITIPSSVKSIEYGTFEDCTSLTSITIPSSVTTIGGYAFRNCSSLASITIPSSVTSIGDYAFENCSSLASITIPSSVTSIGKGAFVGCKGKCIVKCTIPSASHTSGGWFAWADFTSVEIKGATVKGIGDYAFYGCASITSITIDNYVSGAIGECAFYDCKNLKSLIIGNSITSLGFSTFGGCSSLVTLSLGSKVKTIGTSTFINCSNLTSVTIPSSVTSIETNAFYECTSLTKVYCNPSTPPTLGTNVFAYYKYGSGGGTKNLNCTFYVPSSSLSAYKTAQRWSDLASQIVSK